MYFVSLMYERKERVFRILGWNHYESLSSYLTMQPPDVSWGEERCFVVIKEQLRWLLAVVFLYVYYFRSLIRISYRGQANRPTLASSMLRSRRIVIRLKIISNHRESINIDYTVLFYTVDCTDRGTRLFSRNKCNRDFDNLSFKKTVTKNRRKHQQQKQKFSHILFYNNMYFLFLWYFSLA